MIGRVIPVISIVLILSACASNSTASDTERLKAGLARVEKACGAKPGTLKLGSENLVAVIPSPDERFETIECVFRELEKPEFADHIKLGFTGNEAIEKEE